MSQLLFDWGNKMFQEVSLFQRSVVDFRFFSGRNIRSLMLLLLADGVVADFFFLLVVAAVVVYLFVCCWAGRIYSISARFAGISSMEVL